MKRGMNSILLKAVKRVQDDGVSAVVFPQAVLWRCHRSLIADALTARRIHVEHLLSASRRQAHKLTPWALVDGMHLTYPVSATPPAGPI